ncbi:hypothetical protein DSM106972_018030 [Dulcicalothrix desertica PCC 7102]|uniref:SsuA/THI5-like domain-containing protein n=1 Tax=Dulcicalothrix desertica PCC 7102 TaxID=232991 RepID=A0A3S1ARC3_9CYAN|nr:ABC transporter substrate-binding protein [Dulcicalothrix desertica]RUT07543.1 hypothetical protein DSM106972_018030 [Dulcicalothrix desertica PCC 7102]
MVDFPCAIATGIYKDYGLDFTIGVGGPQVASGTQALLGGAVDFLWGKESMLSMPSFLCIPKITVAAIFQKDPQCLIAHPNTGVKTLPDLKGRPIYISAGGSITYWTFLELSTNLLTIKNVLITLTPLHF